MIAWAPSDNPAADRLDCFIATGTAMVIAALTAASASTAAGVISSHAASHAADVQGQATREATAASTHANDQTLAFQEKQAALDAARQETNRHADFDQWAARERRVGSIGEMLGLPARQIPDYVPQNAAPPGSIAGSQPSRNTAPTQGEVNWTAPPDQLASQLSSYFQKRGVPPTEVPYWVKQAGELVNRGQQLNDPAYADKRLAAAEIFGGGGGSSSRSSTAPAGSIAATMPQTLTPAYIAPRVQPGSIRSFATA